MKHYLVSWTNYQNDYRSLILWAKDRAEAKALVNASYVHAANIKARELLKKTEGGVVTGKPRAPDAVIVALENALRAATMETANFGFGTERLKITSGPNTGTVASCDEFIKERTRLYRDSWIIPQIEEALAWAKGATS